MASVSFDQHMNYMDHTMIYNAYRESCSFFIAENKLVSSVDFTRLHAQTTPFVNVLCRLYAPSCTDNTAC